MDKKTLMNEIILCRGAVRKARVAVIRKLIKKIKILKSCKKEGVKEKKLKKSERLLKKVRIMKKAKDDDVTRFALRNPDMEKYLKGSNIDRRQNALACLARHDAVMKRVNAIRKKFPNWEVELPLLLNSIGKKKKLKELNKKGEKKENVGANGKVNDVPKQKKLEGQKEEIKKQPKLTQKECDILEKPKLEKIDDPFFVGKKIIAPKLLNDFNKSENKKVEMQSDSFNNDSNGLVFNTKSFKVKKDFRFNGRIQKHAPETEEKLHPSWAAKKIKLIKPFEGKKIKFSDE